MSDVASLEQCKELYELSGWVMPNYEPKYFEDNKNAFPPYDAGYLLRKLPKFYEDGKIVYLLTLQPNPIGAGWQAHYRFASRTPNSSDTGSMFRQEADTPENCLAMLCTELHKAGILPISGRDL
jgi:hypothetical protein